jgi:hypothetical protein
MRSTVGMGGTSNSRLGESRCRPQGRSRLILRRDGARTRGGGTVPRVGIQAARFATRRTALVDAAAVVLVVVVAQLDAWTGLLDTGLQGPAWLGCLVLTATGLLLILRRRRPFLMVTVTRHAAS